MVLAGALLWWNWNEHRATSPRAPTWVAFALAVLVVVVVTGTIVQADRVGHSGATAVWSPGT